MQREPAQRLSHLVLAYLAPQRWLLIGLVCLLILESLAALSLPYIIGQLSTSVFSSTQLSSSSQFATTPFATPTWQQGLLLIVALLCVQASLRFITGYRVNVLGASILKRLSLRVFGHIQAMPMGYFATRRSGDLLSVLSHDVNQLSYFMSGVLSSIIPALLVGIGALVMMGSIDGWLTLLIALCVPGFLVIMKILGKQIAPLSAQVMDTHAQGMAVATETVQNMALVKACHKEADSQAQYAKQVTTTFGLRCRQLWWQGMLTPLMQLLISLGIVAAVSYSAWQWQQGLLQGGQLVMLLLYGLLFARPMSTLAGVYGQWHQASGASQRILTLLATPTERDTDDALEFVPQGGHVVIRNLKFAYDLPSAASAEQTAWVLRDLSLTLPAGSITVLQGVNGSGKSTLLHLLMRFYLPQQGKILVDGQDSAGVTSRSYRQHVALVSQQVSLVHGSVEDNIRYGMASATDHEVHAAAKQAGAARFIEQLPQGYATAIGENGVLLSGGQRQRLALARALLQGAQLVLLDEPTAAADQDAVAHFKTQIAPALAGKTVLIVTHEPQLCEIAEHAYQLNNGQLYSLGVAHDLIQRNVS